MSFNSIRRAIAKFVLKGAFLRWWCHRKSLLVEDLCLRKIIEMSKQVPNEIPRPKTAPKQQLRKLLFIADVMWEKNELIPELEKICTVEALDIHSALQNLPAEKAAPAVARAVEKFLHENRSENPDAIFFYAKGNHLSEDVFSLLRKKCSGPLIGMNLDDKVAFWPYEVYRNGESYRKWTKHFDLNLTDEKTAISWYKEAGAACLYIPPAMRLPTGLKMPTSTNFKYPLSFVGSPKPDREIIISKLQSYDIPISLFGKGWPGSLWESDTASIYRSSQINLGIGMISPNLTHLKNRDFECPGSGACYLTTFNWELAEWWDIGKEILCYRNTEELIEIVSWYRNRPEDCLAIAQAAWNRAIREHTWEIRFRDIFGRLGFRLPPKTA